MSTVEAVEWIGTGALAERVGITDSAVIKRIKKGDVEAHHGEDGKWLVNLASAREVWEVADAPVAYDAGPSPMGRVILRALAAQGGTIEDGSGNASKPVLDAVERRGFSRQSGSATMRLLEDGDYIVREVEGKRTKRIALAPAGVRWLQDNPEPVAPPTPDPEPEQMSMVHVAAQITGEAAPVPPKRLNGAPAPVEAGPTNGAVQGVEPDAIAHALLRQTVRVLNDSDTATLMAERDALRAHVASLTERLASADERATRAETEAREVRVILHGIEMQLTPMLVGQDATFGWLTATDRADLMRLVGEAARWAGE